MRKAFAHTAAYDTAIAADARGGRCHRRTVRAPPGRTESKDARLELSLSPRDAACDTARTRIRRPRGISMAGDRIKGLGDPEVLQGRELSYTNLLDLDAAARIVLEFDEPAAVVIKHTNPVRRGDRRRRRRTAYVLARDADSLAAFGGIVGLNRPIDAAAAEAIVSTFIEAVIAPAVDDDAPRRAGAKGEHAGR